MIRKARRQKSRPARRSTSQRPSPPASPTLASATPASASWSFLKQRSNESRMKLFAFAALLLVDTPSLAQKVEVTNNQSFDIAMPWKLLDGKTVMVNVAASGKQTIDAGAVEKV